VPRDSQVRLPHPQQGPHQGPRQGPQQGQQEGPQQGPKESCTSKILLKDKFVCSDFGVMLENFVTLTIFVVHFIVSLYKTHPFMFSTETMRATPNFGPLAPLHRVYV
jgi:hypothetical protein